MSRDTLLNRADQWTRQTKADGSSMFTKKGKLAHLKFSGSYVNIIHTCIYVALVCLNLPRSAKFPYRPSPPWSVVVRLGLPINLFNITRPRLKEVSLHRQEAC